jgi:hypothetical protein
MSVLGPIDPSASINEIKEIATAGDFVVVNIVRLDRFHNGKREPSATLRMYLRDKLYQAE